MIKKADKIAGKIVRRLRKGAGLSQEVLAERVGTSYQQIQKYETGQNRISISRLLEIAKALETEGYILVKLIEFELAAEDF